MLRRARGLDSTSDAGTPGDTRRGEKVFARHHAGRVSLSKRRGVVGISRVTGVPAVVLQGRSETPRIFELNIILPRRLCDMK